MPTAFAYPASFEPDVDGRVVVSLPDFSGAHTDGKDKEEATLEAIDLLGSVIARLIVERSEIPVPSKHRVGLGVVPVPLWIAGKLALYLTVRELGMSNSELARCLNVRETVVRRMLDPDHDTKPEKLQAALEKLGRRVTLSLSAA